MADLLIVKNITREEPGLLARVLDEHKISYDIVDLGQDQTFPAPRDYKALVVLGGPDSANDATDKMQQELAQVRAALDAGLPYLGICLGLQVGVKPLAARLCQARKRKSDLLIHPANNILSRQPRLASKTRYWLICRPA